MKAKHIRNLLVKCIINYSKSLNRTQDYQLILPPDNNRLKFMVTDKKPKNHQTIFIIN